MKQKSKDDCWHYQILLQGVPRNAVAEDVERFLAGCQYDASAIQMFGRPQRAADRYLSSTTHLSMALFTRMCSLLVIRWISGLFVADHQLEQSLWSSPHRLRQHMHLLRRTEASVLITKSQCDFFSNLIHLQDKLSTFCFPVWIVYLLVQASSFHQRTIFIYSRKS